MATLGIGLAVRLVVSFFAVFGTDLNIRERLFIPIAWFPKATVQVLFKYVLSLLECQGLRISHIGLYFDLNYFLVSWI